MPFRSQAQAEWAFATKQPWARKWGHKTRLNGKGGIAKLPQYVARKDRKYGKNRPVRGTSLKTAPSTTPGIGNASGPGGLFSSSGLEKRLQPARSNPNRRLRPEVTFKEGEVHTGAMAAVYLSPDVAITVAAAAQNLFGDKAEKPQDLHITLAYLGKVTDDGFQERLPQVTRAIQRYVQIWLEVVGLPLLGVLRGYSAFPDAKDEETGMIPIYRVVDSPMLKMWVNGLKQVLDFAGVTSHRDFEPYTPHVTVAYSHPELVELLESTPAAATPVQFTRVTLALGDIQIDLPLTPLAYKADVPEVAPAKGPIKKPGTKSELIAPGVYRIRGNLCQVAGKFGPCDLASAEGFNKKPKKGKGKGGKGKGGKAAKPKPTEEEKRAKKQADLEQRKAEAEAQRVQNRTNALGALANRPNDKAMEVLDTLRKGGAPDGAMLESMASTGLVDKHVDGTYTLSSGGHAFLNALDSGDPGKANEALAKGKDKVAADTERTAAKLAKAAEREQRKKELAERKAERAAALKKRAEAGSKRASSRKKKREENKKKRTPVKDTDAHVNVIDQGKKPPSTPGTPKPAEVPKTPPRTKPGGNSGPIVERRIPDKSGPIGRSRGPVNTGPFKGRK